MKTLYEYATDRMSEAIQVYFRASNVTKHFTEFDQEALSIDPEVCRMVLAGKHLDPDEISIEDAQRELERVTSVAFDIEESASYSVYIKSRAYIGELMQEARSITNNYSNLSKDTVFNKPYLLPIWQAALNIASKSRMKTLFGSISDQHISRIGAEKISNYANEYFSNHEPTDGQIRERTERTLEGIIRDLVGRLLFETIVEQALIEEEVPYVPEHECSYLTGVIYNHRPDFVIPNEHEPKAFIEVRKSSSRHASLYAKDKMFSAINWKGKHKDMLAILFTEGEWTQESLLTMTKVFDYVIPVSHAKDLAKRISSYLQGDQSILKWIITFKIDNNEIYENNNE